MIYLKDANSDKITENMFVFNDKYYDYDKRNYCTDIYFRESERFSTQTVSDKVFNDTKNGIIKRKFDSFSLVNNLVCGADIFADFEAIFDSNLPDELKYKFLWTYKNIIHFRDFCLKIYPLYDLKEVTSYNIDELIEAVDVCSRAGVYTMASDIITPENISVAEDNSKVLKLVDRYRDFSHKHNKY